MIETLVCLIFLTTAALIQTVKVPQQTPLVVAQVGGNVNLSCSVSEKKETFFYWYKLPLGYMIQTVATETLTKQKRSEQFNSTRFEITGGASERILTIRNVSKDDEATYFCQAGSAYQLHFSAGMYLVVNDHNGPKVTYINQTPDMLAVQEGGSVTLQCSLLSKSKENTDPCPSKDVYWFRYGLGETHPSFIYTQRNNSDAEERRSCVYRLSRTIKTASDTGTYYCAVVTCGEILLGQGTKVETKQNAVVIILGMLLASCVIVIISLIVYIKQRLSEGVKSNASYHGHDRSTRNQSNEQDADEVNYAALNFSTRKAKKKKESPEECVYSAVRAGHQSLHETF